MLACIPSRGNAGRKDQVHDHFGSAPFFTLYNSDTDEVTVLANGNAHHAHGTCHPMNQLQHRKIDCVICGGMGRRAIEALNAEGITIYHAGSRSIDEVIARIKANDLVKMDPRTACRGHGQPRDLKSGTQMGQERGSGFGQLQGGHGGGCGCGGNHGHGED